MKVGAKNVIDAKIWQKSVNVFERKCKAGMNEADEEKKNGLAAAPSILIPDTPSSDSLRLLGLMPTGFQVSQNEWAYRIRQYLKVSSTIPDNLNKIDQVYHQQRDPDQNKLKQP